MLFRRRVAETGIQPVVAHNSYLINIAAAAAPLREQSLAALVEELRSRRRARARRAGDASRLVHDAAASSEGLRLIAEGLRTLLRARRRARADDPARAHGRAGHQSRPPLRAPRDDHRAARRVAARRRLPRHLPPAGGRIRYLFRSRAIARPSTSSIGLVGLDRIKVFHLNDSKKPCGSRVDRHEHIGKGCLGLEPFRRLLNDRALRGAADAARDAEARYAREPAARATSIRGMRATCARCGGLMRKGE